MPLNHEPGRWGWASASRQTGRKVSHARYRTKAAPAMETKPRSGRSVASFAASTSAATMIGASVISGLSATLQPSRAPCLSVCATTNANKGPGARPQDRPSKAPDAKAVIMIAHGKANRGRFQPQPLARSGCEQVGTSRSRSVGFLTSRRTPEPPGRVTSNSFRSVDSSRARDQADVPQNPA